METIKNSGQVSLTTQKTTLTSESQDLEKEATAQESNIDYSKRSQWLRAAILGATDGLVSTASLMMGVSSVKKDVKAMVLIGFAGLVAGACSMAIGEFVSVYSQYDIEVAQRKRDKQREGVVDEDEEEETESKKSFPSPTAAAAASGLAFSAGAMVPLLAAVFIKAYKVRMGVVVGAVSLGLVVFGWLGAVMGKSPVVPSTVRILVGGWLAMCITFWATKLMGSAGI